jgi:hypothetical protein
LLFLTFLERFVFHFQKLSLAFSRCPKKRTIQRDL